jgi:hypothetical protein
MGEHNMDRGEMGMAKEQWGKMKGDEGIWRGKYGQIIQLVGPMEEGKHEGMPKMERANGLDGLEN